MTLTRSVVPLRRMPCTCCATATESVVAQLPGVRSASVDYRRRVLVVEGDGIPDEAIDAAVRDAGCRTCTDDTPPRAQGSGDQTHTTRNAGCAFVG